MEEIWNVNKVLSELELLGKATTKKTYMNHGATEPLFGVTTGALKPLAKKIGKNHSLALALYDTNNYDAMYLAGMIAEPLLMQEEEIWDWMKKAYFPALADYVVAVTLAETPFAQKIADEMIRSDLELYQSAGWSCYEWLLGYLPDSQFDKNKLLEMLYYVEKHIHDACNHTRYTMNKFVIAVGISYKPLHQEAIDTAKKIGEVLVDMKNTNCRVPNATLQIEKAIERKRIGFKRKNVRC